MGSWHGVPGAIKHMSGCYAMGSEVEVDLGRVSISRQKAQIIKNHWEPDATIVAFASVYMAFASAFALHRVIMAKAFFRHRQK